MVKIKQVGIDRMASGTISGRLPRAAALVMMRSSEVNGVEGIGYFVILTVKSREKRQIFGENLGWCQNIVYICSVGYNSLKHGTADGYTMDSTLC